MIEVILSPWEHKWEQTTRVLSADYAGGNNVDYMNANLRLEKAKRAAKNTSV